MSGQNLKPVPSQSLRIGMWITLSTVAIVFGRHLAEKLFVPVGLVFLLGTYRRFRIAPGKLMQRWTIAFYNRPPIVHKFKRFSRLEVKYSPVVAYADLALFGIIAVPFAFALDSFFPWLGGSYEIWLTRDGHDEKLAWQGNSQTQYEENLAALKNATGFDAMVRS